MKRNIGDRTFELIKQEKERYKRLQDFIKNNEPTSGIIADTNYLIKESIILTLMLMSQNFP